MAILLTAPSAAAESNVALEWTVPAGCPGPEGIRRELEQSGASVAELERLQAAVVIERTGQGWHADVETTIDGTPHQRSFDAATCEELAGAVGVVLSLLVAKSNDGSEGAGEAERASVRDQAASDAPDSSTAEPSPATQPPSVEIVPTAGSEGYRLRGVVRLGLGTALGYLPDASVGLEIGAGFSLGAERVLVEFERWAGLHDEVVRSGVPIVASRIGVGPSACFRGAYGVELESCLGVRAVHLDASSEDVVEPQTDEGWFAAALLRVGARWPASKPIRVGAHLQIEAPLRRVEFHFEPSGAIAALPPLGGAFLVDLSWGD